jgi:hypothetical protein
MRTELLQAVELIDDAFGGDGTVSDALDAVRPIIADAESSPKQFGRDVRGAVREQDEEWLEELTETLNRQIRDANDQQLGEYYAHFAPNEDE